MYPETINKYIEFINQNSLSILDNASDNFIVTPNTDIPDYVIGKVRNNFNLHIDEQVFLVRDTTFWGTFDQGLVVTDWGITCIVDNDKPNEIITIKWENVQYAECSGDCIYFFFSSDRNDNYWIHLNLFIKDTDFYCFGEDLAALFTELAQTQIFDSVKAAEARLQEYDEQENYEKVIEEADKMLAMSENDADKSMALYYKAQAYMDIGYQYYFNENLPEDVAKENFQKCREYFKISLDLFNDYEAIVGPADFIYETKSDLHFLGELEEFSDEIAQRYSIASLKTEDRERRERNLNQYKKITNYLFETFNEHGFCNFYDFIDRQFLLLARDENHIAGMYDPDDNIKWVFTLNHIPSDIQFEGIPQANTLYLAHPVRQNLYLPYEGAEEKLFMDKVREFCYLVQCLGATEVVFHSNKGMKVSETFNSTQNINGGFSNLFVDMKGGYSQTNSGKSNYSQKVGVDMVQTFAPSKYPYQPDDLVWLATDSSWKQLIKQRLEGGMLSYTYKIRSTDVSQVSNNQIMDIKASFSFMLQNANANYNVQNDTTFSKREETEWSIQVTFKPLNEFVKQSTANSDSLTPREKEYIEEYKACLADNNGTISNSQRRLLEKVRVSLWVSEPRARELESMCSAPQLTDEEKEYLAEYKACLNDGGIITASERRLLERLRKSLGISEQRAKELEFN